MVFRPAHPSVTAVEDQALDVVGVFNGKLDGHRAAFRDRKDDAALAASRPQYSADVVHSLVEHRQFRRAIREPCAAFVEADDTGEVGQSSKQESGWFER